MSKFYTVFKLNLILILLILEVFVSNTLTIESHESGEVTFITENEGYENYDEESIDSNKQLTLEERCPPHPQVTVENQNLCTKTRCKNDSDCSNTTNIKTVCCFNGCVYSCLPQMQSPPLFDWTEETNLKSNYLKIKYESSSEEYAAAGSQARRLNARKAPGEIALPGGCIVTHDQYVDLLAFKRNNHVQSCSCLQKEVLCQV